MFVAWYLPVLQPVNGGVCPEVPSGGCCREAQAAMSSGGWLAGGDHFGMAWGPDHPQEIPVHHLSSYEWFGRTVGFFWLVLWEVWFVEPTGMKIIAGILMKQQR